jgi:hypothetical protein
MTKRIDGPASRCFRPVLLPGGEPPEELKGRISEDMAGMIPEAPRGEAVIWGIPFQLDGVLLVKDQPVSVALEPFQAGWLVFLHTADLLPQEPGPGGIVSPMRGEGRLNEPAADYVLCYADGSEARFTVRMRHQVGTYIRRWGENCFQAVGGGKPHPRRAAHEQVSPAPGAVDWGYTQTRADSNDWYRWNNWLWAWKNPHPEKTVTGLRFEPLDGKTLVVSAVSAGEVSEQPLRWQARRKALLRLPEGTAFQPDLDATGRLAQIQLDLGQVISALPRTVYPVEDWEAGYNNQRPEVSQNEVLIEYTAHPDACFHLWDGQVIPVSQVTGTDEGGEDAIVPVAPARQRVTVRVLEQGSSRPVAAKLHLHGAAGEYLAPVDRHRIVNAAWFEDFSVDFLHYPSHQCTYIPGETVVDLPLGPVYLEVSKGFEIRPVRKVFQVGAETEEIVVEVEKVLPWRERGWVTADTHVHFLSPISALLEGAAEGVNVVNLLASQWGELMTNVGDFDGQNTWGGRETGGDGEYLVRVGTENRQHVLGHISLLGYRGRIIAPMTTGGPDESALGDPVDILLTEWARQCRQQGGLVVVPHFPNPRAEHAASIIGGDVDALEMTSWGDQYSGISPYSLSDWYRYLNCGHLVPAVGGTDKMSANTAVGTVRTYARIAPEQPFTYDAWMDAVRRAETFVSYGPLLEFTVEGKPMGSRFAMPAGGGTVDVTWLVASVTVPASRVELMVNGEIRESAPLEAGGGSGSWRVRVEQSAWLALLVRGQYPGQSEMIAAHSSPVMIDVAGSQLLAAADAVTILEQIEGALAYIETIGTPAEERAYKRMRLVLEAAHRSLHNRMHQAGFYHDHSPLDDHPEHH